MWIHLLTKLLLPLELLLSELVRLPAWHPPVHLGKRVPARFFSFGANNDANSTGFSLLCHHNVDMVWVKNLTKLLQECFVSGNVTHLKIRRCGGNWGVGDWHWCFSCLWLVHVWLEFIQSSLHCSSHPRYLDRKISKLKIQIYNIFMSDPHITFIQSKVFSHLTQAQWAVVTEGSEETTASLDFLNISFLVVCIYPVLLK